MPRMAAARRLMDIIKSAKINKYGYNSFTRDFNQMLFAPSKMSTYKTESIEVLVERPVTCSTILQADETALLQLLT